MWSTTHFPSAMRSLNPTTRAKAIEIANNLLASGHMDKQQIISVSIDQARTWMRRISADATLIGSVYAMTTIQICPSQS